MSIGSPHFDELLATAPAPQAGRPKVDWQGVDEMLRLEQVEPDSVQAVSWCSHNDKAPPMWGGVPGVAVVHPRGVVATAGKKGMLGRGLKGVVVDFGLCREFGPIEDADDRGFGKFCIAFAGPGSVILGILEWHWTAKRFRDSRQQIMAAAAERDRVLSEVNRLLA